MSRMLEEIRQQPAALARTLTAGIGTPNASSGCWKANGRGWWCWRRAAPRTTPRCSAAICSKSRPAFRSRWPRPPLPRFTGAKVDYPRALVVALSQSGESTDTNLVLEWARDAGRADPGHHQRAREHAGAPGGARLAGARRQGTERGRHQDLHRPDDAALPAGLRAGRTHSRGRSGAPAGNRGRRAGPGGRGGRVSGALPVHGSTRR